MADGDYDEEFYEQLGSLAEHAAAEIVPILMRLFDIRSVIDVGCGDGAFLHEFARCGASELCGIEGKHLPVDFRYRSPEAALTLHDLEHPFDLDRHFDIALCLEVAEHLQYARSAGLVGDLCKLSDVIVFSAAIPGQGGTHHVNEQWPTFWSQQFERHGFTAHDVLRPRLWTNPSVATWYKQNILIYARDGVDDSKLDSAPPPLALVHPDQYLLLLGRAAEVGPVTEQRDHEHRRAEVLDRQRQDVESELAATRGVLDEAVQEHRRVEAERDRLESQLEHRYLLDARRALSWRPLTPPGPRSDDPDPAPQTRWRRTLSDIRSRLTRRSAPPPPSIRRDLLQLFDQEWYLANYPDAVEEGVDPLEHWATVGWREGHDPNPLFDTDWYLAMNEDVARSGVNPLEHYVTVGWRRHADPNPLFDTDFYLENNPEVASSGMNPLEHYLRAGWHEGRDPHRLFATAWYLSTNPDVVTAGQNPLAHFVHHGAIEGRRPRPAVA